MSKTHPPSYLKFLLLLLALQIFTEARGQHVAVEITVDPDAGRAGIKGRFEPGLRRESGQEFLFRSSAGGNDGLGQRISEFSALAPGGVSVKTERRAPNAFVAELIDLEGWRNVVDLRPPPDPAAAAHASWLTENGGVLMLDDLVPIFGGERKQLSAAVTLKLPGGWVSYSSEASDANGRYDIRNVEGAVIFIGPRFRTVRVNTKYGALKLLLDGQWHFSDAEAAGTSAEIYEAYAKRLGPLPTDGAMIALIKFPREEPPGHWEAETRGATVTIASSDTPFKSQSVQRLHEQLRHEIFHLWFPNAVNLTGDYAWFYEGAALYESLKLGVALKRIRFADLLDTISRAYSIDAGAQPRRPLIQSGALDPTVLYARGMVVAFLLDISAMRSSRGRSNFGDALKALFDRYKSLGGGILAKDAIEGVFDRELIRRYVDGVERIDWAAELAAAGLESRAVGRNVELSTTAKPSGRQKEILKRLGYN